MTASKPASRSCRAPGLASRCAAVRSGLLLAEPLVRADNVVYAGPPPRGRQPAATRLAYLATGDGEGTLTGDADLDAYQDPENPWMENAIADLERLAGAS